MELNDPLAREAISNGFFKLAKSFLGLKNYGDHVDELIVKDPLLFLLYFRPVANGRGPTL